MSWSKQYKKSIDCDNPKGFSQKAHCAGRKKRKKGEKTESKSPFSEQFKPYKTPEEIAKKHGVKVSSIEKTSNKVTIADADIVVSGGRGLKGPENWHLIENLAEVLGAATACSKPVSDLGWRPHSEHVGQTVI